METGEVSPEQSAQGLAPHRCETASLEECGQGDVIVARAFEKRQGNPLFRAFAAPEGGLGRLAGLVMARKNVALNRFAVDLLWPLQGESVLEIGFGPGVALAMLAEAVGERGMVCGVERSVLMLSRAAARNAQAIAQGRMRLALCSVAEVGWPDARFHRALCVSNVQFWRPASRCLAELHRMVQPGGVVVFAIHLQWPDRARKTPGFYPEEVRAFTQRLAHAGFNAIEEHLAPGGWDLCIRVRRG